MIKFFKSEGGHATVRLEEFEKGCWIDMVNPTDDEVERSEERRVGTECRL